MNIIFGMCTRNEAESIQQTILAIRDQTHPPDHVYICDASTDATQQIIRDELIQSEIPFTIFHQERYSGHGGARQELFERIGAENSDILCMLDAGNTVNENWIENIAAFWKKYPEYDVLIGPNCSRDVHRECASPHDPLYYRHAAIALDTSFVKSIGGWDTDFDRGEDWDFALRMYQADANVLTSSRWCSQYLNSDPAGIDRERIAGNPTSVPYLSKYGSWYARFHPIQLIKDTGSILFYIIIASFPLLSLFSPEYWHIYITSVLFYVTLYISGSIVIEDKIGIQGIRRAVFQILYTAPAAIRSMVKVIRGQYQRKV